MISDEDYQEYVKKYKAMLEILEEARELKLTIPEIIGELQQQRVFEALKIERVFVDKPLKSSPEQLAYMKDYRWYQKQKKEKQDIELLEKERINKAMQRSFTHCWKCSKNVEVIDPTYQIVQKRNDIKRKIQVLSICPDCDTKIKGFGGYL